MQAIDSVPPPAAQKALRPAMQQQRYFLACQWRPESDVAVRLPGGEMDVPARIASIIDLNRNTKAIRLVPDERFECIPGQYLSLISPGGVVRSYSIANRPGVDGFVELHVRRVPDGRMSNWLHDEAKASDPVLIRGPFGACCYPRSDDRSFPMLLAGTGTGLAPLVGVVADALDHGHSGPIVLVHGALRAEDLYLVEELVALERETGNLRYIRCLVEGEPATGVEIGDAREVALTLLTSTADAGVYLCGAPDFVVPLKRSIFLAGVPLARIHSDAFLPASAEAA